MASEIENMRSDMLICLPLILVFINSAHFLVFISVLITDYREFHSIPLYKTGTTS